MDSTDFSTAENPPGRRMFQKLVPLLFLTVIFYLTFVARIILAPLMPDIEQDLGISHGEAGSLFLLISLGYFTSLAGSGFISSRLYHRKTIILSPLLLGVVLLGLSRCSRVWAIYPGLFLIGASAGIYIPSGIATITSLYVPHNWGKALAVHELAPNISFLTAPLIARCMMPWVSWRGVLGGLGLLSIVFGLVFMALGKGDDAPGEAPNLTALRRLAAQPGFWIMALLFGLGISGTLGIYTMLPLYLVLEKGQTPDGANTLISISRISGLFMVFAAGWLTDTMGFRRTLNGILFLTGAATVLLGITSGTGLVVAVILQPVLAVCFFPAGFAALATVFPPEDRSMAVALTVPLGFVVGGGLVPVMIGLAGDFGSFAGGIVVTGVLISLGTLFSRGLQRSKRSL